MERTEERGKEADEDSGRTAVRLVGGQAMEEGKEEGVRL